MLTKIFLRRAHKGGYYHICLLFILLFEGLLLRWGFYGPPSVVSLQLWYALTNMVKNHSNCSPLTSQMYKSKNSILLSTAFHSPTGHRVYLQICDIFFKRSKLMACPVLGHGKLIICGVRNTTHYCYVCDLSTLQGEVSRVKWWSKRRKTPHLILADFTNQSPKLFRFAI